MSLNLLLLLSLILFQQSICEGEGEGESSGAGGESSGTTGTKITNNCGMVQWNQPTKKEHCTEISLVDGYCCFVVTSSHGNACIRQGEIDEDNKNEITDEMRKAVNRLRTEEPANVAITSVECKGYYITIYGLSLLLLAVML